MSEAQREYTRRWRAANPEAVHAQSKRYREVNRERIRERARLARLANPERARAHEKRYHDANKEKMRAIARKAQLAQYGITREDYEAMSNAQDHACKICGAEACMERSRVLCVDHDHATGAVRGLLCDRCNRALGGFRDSPALLAKATHYLNEAASDA